MLNSNPRYSLSRLSNFNRHSNDNGFEGWGDERDDTLDLALDLLEQGHPREADSLLTGALLNDPDDDRLWLAAGLCRLRRGRIESAAAAFEMSSWISGDDTAQCLFFACEELAG